MRTALTIFSLFLAASWVLGEGKPVAIVGAGTRSEGDRKFFDYYVTARLRLVAEDRGEFLEPAEFPKYSFVAWLRGVPEGKSFSSEQIAATKSYLESGGHLLMTNGAIIGAFGRPFDNAPWVRARTWSYNRENWHPHILRSDHPYLKGVEAEGADWIHTYHALIQPTGVNILGREREWSTLCYAEVGKGRLIFSSYGPYDEMAHVIKDAMMQIYRNMVLAAQPLTEREEAKSYLAKSAPGQKLILWHREWYGSTDERLLWRPAGPRPEELLRSLEFSSAREEIDTAFFCIQSTSDMSELHLRLDPLRGAGGEAADAGAMRLLVMGKEPEVPLQPPKQYGEVDRTRRGPFFLLPPEKLEPLGKPAIRIEAFVPRTVWVQVNTRGLKVGEYQSCVRFSDADDRELAVLPIRVRVAPVRMPHPRIVQLRTWGGSIGNDPRLVREMHRQRCDCGALSYPDMNKVRLRNSETTLQEALRRPQEFLRRKREIPQLDFSALWNDWLDLYLEHGITNLSLFDARTGAFWADAITGEKCDVTKPFEEWPPKWREAYVNYYRQVMDYLRDRGYEMIYPLWTDEPGFEEIAKNYLPRAKAYMEAGMGPGSHWTTAGWMTPEMVNSFAPWTRDFSMYQYGYPNFQRFLREGSVKLPPHSIVGFTRGGTGLAVRQPHAKSRLQGWWIVHQGPPVHFLRTGPIWKGWLYYVDFTAMAWFRLGGVQGERLLAYGSHDPNDKTVDMLTSSDWEGARDGVDDANLARMVEWYLPRLKARASGKWLERLRAIEAERANWFKKESPFPMHEEPVHYRLERKGEPLLEYHLTYAAADSTRDIETAKRYLLGLLMEMKPHASRDDVQVQWHDWWLVRDGKAVATVVLSPGATPETKSAARAIVDHIARETEVALPLKESEDLGSVGGIKVLVAERGDRPASELVQSLDLQLDERYPGKGQYRIIRVPEREIIAILGVGGEGVMRGSRNWRAFLNPQGHWLLEK